MLNVCAKPHIRLLLTGKDSIIKKKKKSCSYVNTEFKYYLSSDWHLLNISQHVFLCSTAQAYRKLRCLNSMMLILTPYCLFYSILSRSNKLIDIKLCVTLQKQKLLLNITLKKTEIKYQNNNILNMKILYNTYLNHWLYLNKQESVSDIHNVLGPAHAQFIAKEERGKCLWRREYRDQAFHVFIPRNCIICRLQLLLYGV